jgi:phosphohistidine phosphatase SixA
MRVSANKRALNLLFSVAALAVLAVLWVIDPSPAGAQVRPGDAELLRGLRAGGQVVVMRHTAADPDKADTDPLHFTSIKSQQPLTDAGRQAARTLGDAWRRLNIAFGDVQTSRFNRALQTAILAGFKTAKPTTELTEGSLVVPPNEQQRRAVYLRQLAVAPIAAGQNRLIVTHKVNIAQAFGKEWFDVKEGEASVFRVERGAYSLVARLQLEDWNRLLLLAQKS